MSICYLPASLSASGFQGAGRQNPGSSQSSAPQATSADIENAFLHSTSKGVQSTNYQFSFTANVSLFVSSLYVTCRELHNQFDKALVDDHAKSLLLKMQKKIKSFA
jgi:hypothetical protein